MIKRGFIRTLWGINDKNDPFYKDNDPTHKIMLKICQKFLIDLELPRHNIYHPPFLTYVFGRYSYEKLIAMGYDCRLVDERPLVWENKRCHYINEHYRHKLEAFLLATSEFDEFVFLDWDVVPISPIPDNFWDILKEKQSIQSPLNKYHKFIHRYAEWRQNEKDRHYIPSAAFVYVGDKQIPINLIQLWDEMNRPPLEEIVIAKYIDQKYDKWIGPEQYFKEFQPVFFDFKSLICSAYYESQYSNQKSIFKCINRNYIKEIMSSNNTPLWWKK